jgi:hypothetical protein
MANNLVEYILSVDSKGAVVGLKAVEDKAKKTGQQLDTTAKKGQSAGDVIKKAFKAIGVAALAGTAAITGAGFAMVKLAKAAKEFTIEAVDMINDLGDIGNRSGIAADTIGALKAAFHASGQEASAVNSVLDIVAKRFGALSRGSKRAVESFEKYGVATRDLEGNLRSNNAILLDAMHIIQGLEDTSLRSRAAVELFGVGGQQLSQALGAGEFDKFLEFVNEFGAVAGPKAAKSAALVQDSISLAEVAFQGLREEIVLNLGLMQTYQNLLNAQMAFFAGLKEVVADQRRLFAEATEAFLKFGEATAGFFAQVLIGAQSASDGTQGLLENIFLIGQAILKRLLSPMANFLFLSREIAEFMGSSYSKDLDKALKATQDLGKVLSHDTAEGMEAFISFSDGASKSLKLFSEITAGASHTITGADLNLNDFGETAVDVTEQIDHLAEAASVLNGVFSKLGIPRSLQFGGIKEAEEQVMKLLQGLSDLGASGTFGDIKTKQGNISLDMRAQNLAAGLAAVAPQIGAAIAITAGLIQLAEKIGSMGDSIEEIKNELTKSVQERAQVIERGLQALPTILNDVLPQILQTLADAIIFGLAKFGAENINRLITAFRQIFTREGRQERREQRQAGVLGADRVAEFVRRIGVLGNIAFEGMRAGGRIPSARSGLNFTGDNAGLALLHKNEFVVPESGQAPQSVKRAMGGMGGSVNLVINAQVVERNAVDELVRQIERRFRTFGQSTSPLFGG